MSKKDTHVFRGGIVALSPAWGSPSQLLPAGAGFCFLYREELLSRSIINSAISAKQWFIAFSENNQRILYAVSTHPSERRQVMCLSSHALPRIFRRLHSPSIPEHMRFKGDTDSGYSVLNSDSLESNQPLSKRAVSYRHDKPLEGPFAGTTLGRCWRCREMGLLAALTSQ